MQITPWEAVGNARVRACCLGKGWAGVSSYLLHVCTAMHLLWTRKCKEIQSVRVGAGWIPNSDSKGSEHNLHLTVILTETQGLGMAPDCTCWK